MGAREIDVYGAIDNWARWCSSWRSMLPDCVTNWQMIDQVEYKSCHQTAEEKVREALVHREPDELEAMRVERIVAIALNNPCRVAVRTHYVDLPEWKRLEKGLSEDIWTEWQARHATRRASWYFSPDMYREAVRQAVDEIEAAL